MRRMHVIESRRTATASPETLMVMCRHSNLDDALPNFIGRLCSKRDPAPQARKESSFQGTSAYGNEWILEKSRHSGETLQSIALECHHTVPEVVELWGMSEVVRRLSRKKSGVRRWGTPKTLRKRGHRQPTHSRERVDRVHQRLGQLLHRGHLRRWSIWFRRFQLRSQLSPSLCARSAVSCSCLAFTKAHSAFP